MFGVSAVDRVQEALDAAHATQAALNAFTHIDDEQALARASEIDVTVESGEYNAPLAGVPVALKDLIDRQGRVTTCGSAFYRHDAIRSAPAVERLEQAGAVIVGRTGLHEFAFGFSSENPHFGPVRNPWDRATSPGGSSGGSAAAVAAAITPIAIGTDTGGSVRVPAALCGCFGLKVTYGRIPLDGVFPLVASIDTVGPLADSIENLDTAYRVMSGDNTTESGPSRLRIGIPQPWLDQAPMDDQVDSAFSTVIGQLGDLGHDVQPLRLPDVLPGREIILAIAAEVTDVHRGFRAKGLPYGDDVAARLEDCASVTDEESQTGHAWQQMIRSSLADAFNTVDLLITPTVPVMRKVIGVDTIGDLHHRVVLSWFTALVNHTLHPALAMPLLGRGAPPVSLQAIGPMGSEPALLRFGRELESSAMVGFRPAIDKPG
ncbi:MAG TPA: amidase [Acidimicrobiia bacterium]|nr:amidase [Acidimicrobiia bacterium]